MISILASKSILRRLVSQSRRYFCSGGGASSKLIGRPSLMLPPSFPAVEEEGGIGISKMEYNFYSPLKKTKGDKWYYDINFPPLGEDMVREKDLVRFNSSGGQDEVDLMKNKNTNWVGSSHGWLALFNKDNRSISLINPVSGRSIPLPPLRGEPFLDEEKTLKVILSHSPTDENFQAVAFHGSLDRAALCSPGCCNHWIPIGPWNQLKSYDDFVYSASRKAFVSSTRVAFTDELEFWDPSSTMEAPVKTLRAPPVSGSDPTRWTYLVSEEKSGKLFMVRRYLIDGKRVDYNVYSIESYVGTGDVVQLREELLDDLVMFIGMNHCFAVKASRFPEYRPNCIYFSGGWNWKNGSQNKPFADIYDYEKKKATYYDYDEKYSQLFYSTSGHDFPFEHKLPWFTLTKDQTNCE